MKPLLLMGVSLLLWQQASGRSEMQPVAIPPGQAELVQGNNAFAIDLYGQLRQRVGNLFFSPESISTAFAMAYAGARGETATQMAHTLHFTQPPAELHKAIGGLLNNLNAPHEGYQLHVADALWAEKDEPFLESFVKLMANDYGAGFNQVDFKTAPEAVRMKVNEWVEQKTEDKIKDLLPPGSVNPTTRMVLTNAIYFKGDWQTKFDKARTTDEDFHVSAAQASKTPLMNLQTKLSYFDGGTFQAVAIPYKSGELSMIVLLPKQVDGLAALEKSMTAENAQHWFSQLAGARKVILALPKFKMTQQFELGSTLRAMGMANAFEKNGADFSGMTGNRKLSISAAIHKAFIDVNEEGTEAAAATGIVMRSNAAAFEERPVIFRADHPFLFLLRDNRSGGILFMGRVEDPAK